MKLLLDTLTDEQALRFGKLTQPEQEFVAQVGAAYIQLDISKTLNSSVPMEIGLELIEKLKQRIMNEPAQEEFEWRFCSRDGEYDFTVKAYNQLQAYNKAYDRYGPKVADMKYQLNEHK
jgi:hypothetical protein